MQRSLAKDQFIDALIMNDREIRMKLQESDPKTLDEAVTRALQIEAMYSAELRRGKGWSKGKNTELVEFPKQTPMLILSLKGTSVPTCFKTESTNQFSIFNATRRRNICTDT